MPYHLLEGMDLIEGYSNNDLVEGNFETLKKDIQHPENIIHKPTQKPVEKAKTTPTEKVTSTPTPSKFISGVDTLTDSNIKEILDKLNTQISGSFTSVLMDQIHTINKKSSNKLYDNKDERYVLNISKMSLIDLGDPKNSDELDFIENIIINFLDISDNNIGKIFKEIDVCGEDLNVNILLTLAIFYSRNKTEFNNVSDNNLIKVDGILNRLSRYFPDLFQKILTGMKMCDSDKDPNKYAVIENIYKTMFKFNNTTVNLGLMDGISKLFSMLRGMKTIEMVVLIIAIAFVISKVFDMFRVKVDV
jgi:hypothetical protein